MGRTTGMGREGRKIGKRGETRHKGKEKRVERVLGVRREKKEN